MNRFSPASSAGSRTGFTLIELLVVIAIIGILAAILLPVYGRVQYSARKVQAVNDMRNIKTAMLAFYSDYQKYPLNDDQARAAAPGYPGHAGGYDTVYGDPGPAALYSTADLFDILLAIDIGPKHKNANNAINTSQTVYWTGQIAKSAGKPLGGISTQDVKWKDHNGTAYTIPKGSFMDPWGRSYLVFIDANMDGDFSEASTWYYVDSSTTKGTVTTSLPPVGLGFGSMGPDGYFGSVTSKVPFGDGILKGSDDVVIWR